jgi:CheY-like chemotaxis protein/two-component sensor histidine kinase
MINDILDLAKIDAGQVTLDITKVDLQSVCQASLRMIHQLAVKKKQDVSFIMDHEIGLVWADQRRLKQMIVNLLSNAVKFTPEGGKLGLEVTANRQQDIVSITVWDEGVGISESDMTRLFKPFVQVDSSLARKSSGTGLGLALVAQMARLHGGHVRAKSAPGKGSRFSIVLPWSHAERTGSLSSARSAALSSIENSQEMNSYTIMVAEDIPAVVMMMEDYLKAAGYSVVVARNGREAIAQIEALKPDLILMDIMMPDMDGFEATKQIRSDPTMQNIPILGLTALAMPGDRERCLEAGMNDHLTKPINLMELLRTIRTYLPSP